MPAVPPTVWKPVHRGSPASTPAADRHHGWQVLQRNPPACEYPIWASKISISSVRISWSVGLKRVSSEPPL
jgi:hypothetical protein